METRLCNPSLWAIWWLSSLLWSVEKGINLLKMCCHNLKTVWIDIFFVIFSTEKVNEIIKLVFYFKSKFCDFLTQLTYSSHHKWDQHLTDPIILEKNLYSFDCWLFNTKALFARPNPVSAIISWIISWQTITIFLFCMVWFAN